MGSGDGGVKISQEELAAMLITLAQTMDLFSNFETRLGNMAFNVPYWSNLGPIDDDSGDLKYTLEDMTDTTESLAETIALDLGAFFHKVDSVRDSWAELDAALAQLESKG
jgi:hypothetical protein